MVLSKNILFKGAMWTTAAFSVGQLLRVASGVILARLLAPELFGIMQVAYSLRTGIDLLSDVGVGQNIIYNKDAELPAFYNTAWTLQLLRGILLWVVICLAAWPAAGFYQSPLLARVMPIAGISFVLWGFASTSRFQLQKRMQYDTLTYFEAVVAVIATGSQVIFAYVSPTIWALVFGSLVAPAVAMVGSHFLLKDVRNELTISRSYAGQILSFGKWVFLSSIIYFLATNFDRLYLAKVIPLSLLGIYGIARSISELLSMLVQRLGNAVVFPFVASHAQNLTREELHSQLAPIRLKFLLIAGVGFSFFAATADVAIKVLFDQRYHAASWMLPLLILGAWFATLCSINESSLLGLGRPIYSAFGNGAKLAFLLVCLPFGVLHFGILGGVAVVAVADLWRYVAFLSGQKRERFSFFRQDLLTTAAVLALVVVFEWLRWFLGFGSSFEQLSNLH